MLPDSYQNKNKAYRCRPTKDAPEEEQDGDNRPDKGASNSKPQETKDKAEQPEPEGNKTASADLQHTATVWNAVKIFIIIKNICHLLRILKVYFSFQSVTSPTSTESHPPLSNMLVSPTGQTLKKVCLK